MTRTAETLEKKNGVWYRTGKKITCYLYGQMAEGDKVWADDNTDEQYYLMRIKNKFYFIPFG